VSVAAAIMHPAQLTKAGLQGDRRNPTIAVDRRFSMLATLICVLSLGKGEVEDNVTLYFLVIPTDVL